MYGKRDSFLSDVEIGPETFSLVSENVQTGFQIV